MGCSVTVLAFPPDELSSLLLVGISSLLVLSLVVMTSSLALGGTVVTFMVGTLEVLVGRPRVKNTHIRIRANFECNSHNCIF